MKGGKVLLAVLTCGIGALIYLAIREYFKQQAESRTKAKEYITEAITEAG